MKNLLVFGDSIAWGANDSEYGGWVTLLRNYFEDKEGVPIEHVYNLSVSGNDTKDVLARFDGEAKVRKPGIVMLAVGVNDSKRIDTKDNPETSEEQFEKNYNALISKAKQCAKRVICLGLTPVNEEKTTPIPWNTRKSYYSEFVKEYDQIIQDVVQKERVEYIPLYDLMDAKDFEDGLHPDSEGHRIIFEAVKEYLEK